MTHTLSFTAALAIHTFSRKHAHPLSMFCIIMAYGSTPYVGMTPKKNGGHIQSAQMTRSKCPR